MTNLYIVTILYIILCTINLILLILGVYSKLLKQWIDDSIVEEDRALVYPSHFFWLLVMLFTPLIDIIPLILLIFIGFNKLLDYIFNYINNFNPYIDKPDTKDQTLQL